MATAFGASGAIPEPPVPESNPLHAVGCVVSTRSADSAREVPARDESVSQLDAQASGANPCCSRVLAMRSLPACDGWA